MIRVERRAKEGQTAGVVPVCVREQEMAPLHATLHERHSELAQTGSRIEHDGASTRLDFDATRIASDPRVALPWARDAAADAPEGHVHGDRPERDASSPARARRLVRIGATIDGSRPRVMTTSREAFGSKGHAEREITG